MISKTEARKLILDLFEEEALVIGGLVAVHQIEDRLVWRIIQNLDAIRAKAMRRLGGSEPNLDDPVAASRPNLKPHPAIEDFLLKLRRS